MITVDNEFYVFSVYTLQNQRNTLSFDFTAKDNTDEYLSITVRSRLNSPCIRSYNDIKEDSVIGSIIVPRDKAEENISSTLLLVASLLLKQPWVPSTQENLEILEEFIKTYSSSKNIK